MGVIGVLVLGPRRWVVGMLTRLGEGATMGLMALADTFSDLPPLAFSHYLVRISALGEVSWVGGVGSGELHSDTLEWLRRGALLPKPTAPLLPLTTSTLAPTSQDWHPEPGVCVVAMTAETPAVQGVSRRPGDATLWLLWLGERRLGGHRPSRLRLPVFPAVFTPGQV